MDEILDRMIELVVNLDDTVAGMEGDLEELVANAGSVDLDACADLLAKACTLLTELNNALKEDHRLNSMLAIISDGNDRVLTDQQVHDAFFEHAERINGLRLPGAIPAALVEYIRKQLLEVQAELQNQISSEKLANELDRGDIIKNLTAAQEHICYAHNQFSQVVNVLTLRQLRQALTETSLVLKDVIIVGVDVSVLIGDITTLLALKSAYSIYTGVRSLRRRLGGFGERIRQWFRPPE